MKLILHPNKGNDRLSNQYSRAFSKADELYIVSAFLTEWDDSLLLRKGCRKFRLIIGKDFGITKKSACNEVIQWLPEGRKRNFKVAESINGFHPKAIFWKELNGNCFAIIGSSNLTRAAFETNYEANYFCKLSKEEFAKAKEWIKQIENNSTVVTKRWLNTYQERPPSSKKGAGKAFKKLTCPRLLCHRIR